MAWVCYRRRSQWLRLVLGLCCLPLILRRGYCFDVGMNIGCDDCNHPYTLCHIDHCAAYHIARAGLKVLVLEASVQGQSSLSLSLSLSLSEFKFKSSLRRVSPLLSIGPIHRLWPIRTKYALNL